MEIRVLRYFLAVCQEKSITAAAKRLHISQPSLSTQIRNLEAELGVPLLIRGHRQVTLTESGYYLRDRAREIVAMADGTAATLGRGRAISGVLRIGAGQSPALEPVMRAIDRLLQEHPHVRVSLADENADDVERQVKQGGLDFGIVMGRRPVGEFDSLALPGHNRFVAVFGRDLPLAGRTAIRAQDLVGYPLVFSSQAFVDQNFTEWWGGLKERMRISVTSNLAYNASLLTAQGHAVQITYDGLVATGGDARLISRPLSPEVTDPNILIWKKDTRLSRLGTAFLDRVRAEMGAGQRADDSTH